MTDQTKKKTLAQLRAEKKQRLEEANLGCLLAEELQVDFEASEQQKRANEARYDRLGPFLIRTNRASQLLQYHPNTVPYARILYLKGQIHNELAEVSLAVSTFRQADELFAAAERDGLLNLANHIQ